MLTIVMFNLFLKLKTFFPVVWVYASYKNRIHVNNLEGGYATTTPTMLWKITIKEMNFRTFNYGFFLTHFLNVTSGKNQNNSLRSGVNFSLTRLIYSHLIESCCCFWFVTSQGQWEFKKRQEFIISGVFFPSNAHNSKIQSFPENKYSFTARLSL